MPTPEQNNAIAVEFFDTAWNKGEIRTDLLHPEAVDHSAVGGEKKTETGAESFKKIVTMFRSAMPDDASPEAQADAFIDLLDALGIDRVPVVGGSAGALSAIAFALRHPDRCTALIALVPATYAPDRSLAPPPGALTSFIIERGLRSDALFWVGLATAESAMVGALLATDPALVAAASPEE